MPRVARCVIAGVALHIVQRGINRGDCFFAPGDYATYLGLLQTFSADFDCPVHAYCLMTNHVHLLVTPARFDSCALLMKKLGQCYVQYINRRLGRTGTLWEGRYYSCMVTSDVYVLGCYRYIEANPVRAGMVPAAPDYRWSSYGANAEGHPVEWLRPHPSYEALSDEADRRRGAYRSLCEAPPPERIVDEIRRATRRGVAAGSVRRARGRPAKARRNAARTAAK
jgi:putative transposase